MSYKDWGRYTLDDIAENIFSGGTPDTRKTDYWNGKLNWLSSGETRNTFITKTENTITELGVKESSTRLAKIGDIVIASAGQGFTRGQASLCKIDTYINQSLISIRCNREKAFNVYVFYNLRYRYEELRQISDGHSIRGSLTTKMMKSVDIKLPSLETQKAIANILSSLDDKIELNNKINKNLEELAQTLYKRWFVDFEFPNEDGEPYKSSGGEMVESELGLIPKGWKVKTIDEITIFNKRGIAPKYTDDGSGIPVINQRCIRNHTIIEEAVQYHNPDAKKTPKELFQLEWDVLINSMGVGTLGRVSISSIDHKKLVHSCITILRPSTKVILQPIFAYMMLSFEDKFIQMGEGTTGQTSLNNKLLGQMKVVVPPIILQDSISNTINSLQNLIDNNYLENERLAKTRNELLPKLMNGEIEVPIEE